MWIIFQICSPNLLCFCSLIRSAFTMPVWTVWTAAGSGCSWLRIGYWDRWRDPTPQSGPAPHRPSSAGAAAPRAPVHTACSTTAPGRRPLPAPPVTPPRRKRRRKEGFSSTLIGTVSPSRASPGRGCGAMWPPSTPRARRWWTGYGTLQTCQK